MARVLVWDLPTRLFHWLLALCVILLVVSGNVGGNAMLWHFRLGYVVMGLLIFRLLWGVFGGHWSRFAQWLYGPKRIWRYLRARPHPHDEIGHSPLASFSVLGLLSLLALQVLTGLCADDEIAFAGPWVPWVRPEWSSAATEWHTHLGKSVLLLLLLLHVLALLVYRLKGKSGLVAAMWHGYKAASVGINIPESTDGLRQRALALLLAGVAAGVVYWCVGVWPV